MTGSEGGVSELDPSAWRALLAEKAGCVVIDVRTPDEYAGSHIPDAVNIDLSSPAFTELIGKLDRNGTYLVCCRLGGRGAKAARIMRQLGFTRVYNLSGGVDRWRAQGLPVRSEVS